MIFTMLDLIVFGAETAEDFFHTQTSLRINQAVSPTAWKEQKLSCLRTFLWRFFHVVLCFDFQLDKSLESMTDVKRLFPLHCTFKWNLLPYVSHAIKPKTLVLQQVCSTIAIDLCHLPSQVCKGAWEMATAFAHTESDCV